MLSLLLERRSVNGGTILATAFQEAQEAIRRAIGQRLSSQLAQALDHLLGRSSHVRRCHVPPWLEQTGKCLRCGSHRCRRFRRNGSRTRTLITLWGDIRLRLPRVLCVCGGSVHLDFGEWPAPYQRLSPQVDRQIQRWGSLCLSLRQMQQELEHTFIGALGLRTLLTRLHQCQHLDPTADPDEVPPILQVDAIWLTQLRPTGKVRRDAKGRRRAVKGRYKRPLFIALGLWPQTGRCEILAWQLGEGETEAAWTAFLSQLEAQGLRGEKGLELIIHDGGGGLCAALQTVHFAAADQRCLFHKLRNIAQAIQLPDGLSRQERKRRGKAILKEFQAIWEARRYRTALRRYLRVCRRYRQTQPEAVATLRRDFRATLTYYQLEKKHPTWARQYLRTISQLERCNRRVRRRLRAAGAYHSDQGIMAMIAQEASLLHSAQPRNKHRT